MLLLVNFASAVGGAIMDSGDVHQNLMMQLLSDSGKASKFTRRGLMCSGWRSDVYLRFREYLGELSF
jgi:hypothetical protein